MALQKKKIGGYTYFEQYMSCPVCASRGIHTPQSHWSHHVCGGTMYVGDNAYYHCNTCSSESHVKNWRYGCPSHSSNQGEYDFIGTTAGELAANIAVAGMLVTQAGMTWLKAFLDNMGEF
ncbi:MULTISPECIES: hypothetical protein [unclassified Chryseobacterium]|uniref:hypothetical protein n=1 Tax=unclassified Chryseobacterium TaxID=2593645 RepID=UPI000D372DCA|nr:MULTISPECIES: hypothetical protein [unclassified Chryseobacterium]PTT76554.1 hypothetical protein DBR25_05575 [Chryseobacterium sp. HMWF001]PVV55561.1 hypothetical protein DD829_13910 [Chryseobacterium sp. HMWF035]